MSHKPLPRPGGRSARVQQAVHAAVSALDDGEGRTQLTIPMIAEHAGVTPSTIYRRWGSLRELLADVAAERLRPEAPLSDTGSLEEDLMVWAGEFMEEMTSRPGQQALADALGSASHDPRTRCYDWQCEQIALMLSRARDRGESSLPSVDTLIDGVMAPLLYRVSHAPESLSETRLRHWVRRALGSACENFRANTE